MRVIFWLAFSFGAFAYVEKELTGDCMAAIMAVTASVALAALPEQVPGDTKTRLCDLSEERIDRAEDVVDDQAGRLKPTEGVQHALDNMNFNKVHVCS